jgi:hypothetical protein
MIGSVISCKSSDYGSNTPNQSFEKVISYVTLLVCLFLFFIDVRVLRKNVPIPIAGTKRLIYIKT